MIDEWAGFNGTLLVYYDKDDLVTDARFFANESPRSHSFLFDFIGY
jgi:hypothetical protein